MSNYHSQSDNELRFLSTVRQAVAPDSDMPRDKRAYPEIFAYTDDRQLVDTVENRTDLDQQGLASAFMDNADPQSLSVYCIKSLDEAADIIVNIARNRVPEFSNNRHIIQHAHKDISGLKLWERFSEDPITVHTTYREDSELRDKTIASFIGITVADWGIADSATLVQCTRPGMPQSTSLVPSIHIGFVRRSRILANLSEAYAMMRRDSALNSWCFISGPSKTADIEAHMVYGAHGPKEMHICILEDTKT
ncbi:LutC/YkgG family protein [Desulfosediminicola ganghwensis]|uniref:LutC/YkgG family protein n=1 Tax=Desulfosediminicola ganghwensis TaxID=2569540 RepID=UPI0010AD09F1|nr:lactate utilization protein [Desulfosediminicola ganghwensis]